MQFILAERVPVRPSAKRVYNFVARGWQVECDFALVLIKSCFYRFGIRSCLGTNHKNLQKTPFSKTSLCILCFQATQLVSHRLGLILFILCLRWRIAWRIADYFTLRLITAGSKHNSVQFDKWLEILALEDLRPKERRPELHREQQRKKRVRSSSAR